MKDLNMILKASVVISVALCVLGDRRPAFSEQRIEQQFSGHHGDLSHVGHHQPEHHEEYAWSYPSYEFSYKVVDPHTHDIKEQHEVRRKDEVNGFYWLIQPDGHKRYVKYHADDKHGFTADVLYSKPKDENSKELNDRHEQEKKEQEKKEKEKKEHEKKVKERKEQEKKEQERKEQEKREKERKAHENIVKERKEQERREKERQEHEKQENENNRRGMRGYKRRHFVGHENEHHEEKNRFFDHVHIAWNEDHSEEQEDKRDEHKLIKENKKERNDKDQNKKPNNNDQSKPEEKDQKQHDDKTDLWLGLQGWYHKKGDESQKKELVKDERKKENHGAKIEDKTVKEPVIHIKKIDIKPENVQEVDKSPKNDDEKPKIQVEKEETKPSHNKEVKNSEKLIKEKKKVPKKDDHDKRGGIWGGLQIWGDHGDEDENEDEHKAVNWHGRHSWGWSQNGRDDRKRGGNEARKEGLGAWGEHKREHRRARPSYHAPYEFGERLH